MSSHQHSYYRSQIIRRTPIVSIDDALRVIEKARTTHPILAAKAAHIDRTLAGVALLRRSGGM
jgi:hypothetical protein